MLKTDKWKLIENGLGVAYRTCGKAMTGAPVTELGYNTMVRT